MNWEMIGAIGEIEMDLVPLYHPGGSSQMPVSRGGGIG